MMAEFPTVTGTGGSNVSVVPTVAVPIACAVKTNENKLKATILAAVKIRKKE